MNQDYRISYRKPGPLAQAVSFVLAVIALALAAIFGVFILATLAGLIAIAAIGISLRVWWLRRQFEKAVREGKEPGDAMQGEFIVIEKRPADPPER